MGGPRRGGRLRLAEILKLHTASAGLFRRCDWSTPGFSVYRALCPNLPPPPRPFLALWLCPRLFFPFLPFVLSTPILPFTVRSPFLLSQTYVSPGRSPSRFLPHSFDTYPIYSHLPFHNQLSFRSCSRKHPREYHFTAAYTVCPVCDAPLSANNPLLQLANDCDRVLAMSEVG